VPAEDAHFVGKRGELRERGEHYPVFSKSVRSPPRTSCRLRRPRARRRRRTRCGRAYGPECAARARRGCPPRPCRPPRGRA
jgi:hypothetical protein